MPIPVSTDTEVGFPGDVPGRVLSEVTAVLGDAVFGLVDDRGVRCRLARIDGWFGPVGVTGGVEQRANDEGGWLSPSYRKPRLLTLIVRLTGSSWEHLSPSLTNVVAAIPQVALDTLYVSDYAETLQAQVRQDGDPLVTRQGAGAELSISLIAPDSRRYSTDLTSVSTGLPRTTGGLSLPISLPVSIGATVSSGVLTAINDGNQATRPVFTVFGPCPPGSIIHRASGRALSWHEALAAGRFLVIDTDNKEALLDGTAARVVTGTWFDYQPGLNEVAFQAPVYDPGARLESSHRSAFR